MSGDSFLQLSGNLAENLRYLRNRRDLTQAQVSKLSGLPRSTLATIESGEGNPTLQVLSKLSASFGVSIEELISTPRAQCQYYPNGSLPILGKGKGVEVRKLLPDPLPGVEIERLSLKAGFKKKGVPHRPGTKEYLICELGNITLWAHGERYDLCPLDVVAFQGDQPHSYVNDGRENAVGYSIVLLAPTFR